MLSGILDRATLSSPIKEMLDVTAQRTKAIAGRVAQAPMPIPFSADGAEA